MSPKTKKGLWKESTSQLCSLYDMVYNGVVLVDEEGIIQVYNQAARKGSGAFSLAG